MPFLLWFATLYIARAGSPSPRHAAAGDRPQLGDDAYCLVGQPGCNTDADTGYIKQHTHKGPTGHFSQSPYKFGNATCNLASQLLWEWHHPVDRYATVVVSTPLVDEQLNIYSTSMDGVRKFSIGGDLIWTWNAPSLIPNNGALMEGKVINVMISGEAFALNMSTGELLWTVLVDPRGIGGETGFVSGESGRVLVDVLAPQPPMENGRTVNPEVVALDVADGQELWRYKPDVGSWNFFPVYPGDGTALFQAWTGGAYRVNMSDGSEIWKSGISKDDKSFTDGGPALGPNGMFYTVRSEADAIHAMDTGPGAGSIRAWNVSDGSLVWQVSGLDEGIFSWPAIGRTNENASLSLIVTVGSLGGWTFAEVWHHEQALGASVGVAVGFLIAAAWGSMEDSSAKGPSSGAAVFGRPPFLVVAAILTAPLIVVCIRFKFGILGMFLPGLSPALLPPLYAVSAAAVAGRLGRLRTHQAGCALWALMWRPALCAAICTALATVAAWAAFSKNRFPASVQSFDANSGKQQWRVDLPTWRGHAAAGDDDGYAYRVATGHLRTACRPATSSGYTMDAQGAVYFGHMDGRLYRIKDWDLDGVVDFHTEVCSYDTKSAGLTGSPTIAPGYLIYASCDGLYVFRDEQ